MQTKNARRIGKRAWEGADLVMEVVSEDEESRVRDYETKPPEYAAAGISEYWIVDPQLRRITVLRRRGQAYVLHGKFVDGERVTSRLLSGFGVDVTSVLDAGKLPGDQESQL
jgi:Uma2 family endonuclease